MATSSERTTTPFTFLYYDTPKHGASHRRTVKSHISSKYRTAIRQQTKPRYALPRRSSFEDDGFRHPISTPMRRTKKTTHVMRQNEVVKLSQRPIPLLLETGFSGTRVDPFNSFPGQQTPCVTNAIDFYTHVISPLQEPLLLAFNMVNPMMTWMFPLILQHESAFHGAVALSQAYFEKSQAPTAMPSEEILFHRRKAVSVLRDELSNLKGAPNDGALMTVLALASFDVLYRKDSTANSKAVALMVALKGGLDNLEGRGLIKAFLIQIDYFWMLETGMESVFPFSKRKRQRAYPQHPFNADILSLIASLPPGFAALARQSSLRIDVLQILSRVGKFLHSQTSNCPLPIERDPIPEDQQYPDIFDACSCLHSSASTVHSLEKNICLAIILFSFNIHSQARSSSKLTAFRGSRQELTRSLPFTSRRNPEERYCLVWIWMIVIGSWQWDLDLSQDGLSKCRSFFDNFEEARSWNRIESAMHQFFWYEPLAKGWKASWQQVLGSYQRMNQWDMHLQSTDITSPPKINRSARESTPTSTSSAATMTEDGLGGFNIPERTRLASPATGGEKSEGARQATTLPPMLTLDTYVEWIY
ncbi:uncharacterized protein Z518_00551 [Rhinocladiella mackenziei CBS 650.93]|uniref:Transcription factor domain-containing protein n=1 Tax=Rhinocladiella mackenziei CBS 650.93 TaxID=1442369 RepID=A0A0D2J1B3_9EURO|nr:uncharacterized protein Z518_00551 [Rhinocladiella mackenziei CBS 650.93]KIX09471.1 hypothetical protein Z518_00551 [Rhinocladiella mackenziei CBS 650.93]